MVYALVTLYNPSEDNIENIRILQKQVDKVIVCDNSNYDNSRRLPEDCLYSSMKKNLGLSMAFNKVLNDKSFAIKNNDYIVFFDQDSKIKEKHISMLIADYESSIDAGVCVGCIGPVFFNTSNNTVEIPHDKKELIKNVYEVKSIITSSMLCKYGTLKKVGFWNAEVFLDMADWDLCWRLMRLGYKCLMTANVSLIHSVGLGEKRLGPFRLRVGAPIREYYEIRDCLYLMHKDYVPVKFKIRFTCMLTIRNILHILLYDNKRQRYIYITRGIKDYFLKKHGEYSE